MIISLSCCAIIDENCFLKVFLSHHVATTEVGKFPSLIYVTILKFTRGEGDGKYFITDVEVEGGTIKSPSFPSTIPMYSNYSPKFNYMEFSLTFIALANCFLKHERSHKAAAFEVESDLDCFPP